MHVSDIEFDLLSRGELPRQDADAAMAHVAQCQSCAIRQKSFATAEDEIESSLQLLDYPVAAVDVSSIIRRANRGRNASFWRIAAGIAFLATAGVAAAMPGSPVRAWLNRGGVERPAVSPAPAPKPELPQPQTPSTAGIAIEAGDSVALIFDSDQSEGSIRITFDTGSEIRVRAVGGEAGFEVRSEGLRVRNRASIANYDVAVPSSARSVEIRVAGRLVFQKRDEAVIRGPQLEQDGSYVVELGAQGTQP